MFVRPNFTMIKPERTAAEENRVECWAIGISTFFFVLLIAAAFYFFNPYIVASMLFGWVGGAVILGYMVWRAPTVEGS